jgi:hypothetical protein
MAQQTFEELVAAVKQAESRGKRYADNGKLTTSSKGALGEMQVMPKTIRDPGFGVIPAKDASPDEIARVGKDYLQAMTKKYGDTEKALIAYNMGPGATDKWIAAGGKTEKLPEETKTYVERVKGLLGGNVSRETKAEPTPAEEVMTKALPAGTTAQAPRDLPKFDVKAMPASYQAAFALAALADAQDAEDDKAFDENKGTETESFFANYKPVNHLASLDLSVQPLQFADGGDVDAEDLSKPSFGNPNIRKQGEAARRLAAMRDVNTLPDPKTYAVASGLMGTRPDEMGFSVMHPKYKEIMNAADPAFAAGTALQVAPAAQAVGGGKAAKMLARMAGEELNAGLFGERPGTLLDTLTAPAQPKFMFVRARPEAAARHADLKAKGLSPEEIRAQNLTHVDNRGNVIEEISDAPAVLKQKTSSVLRNYYDMLEHPELKGIYPGYDMPDVLMETSKRKGDPLALGTFNVQDNVIMGRVRDLPGDDARNVVRGTLLHEGQHAIQSMEGFTEGANPGAFIAYVKARQGKYHSDPAVNANVIREMERAYPNIGAITDDFQSRFEADKYMKYTSKDPDRYIGETLYRHMPGEVQAELARVRGNLSPEQLKATPHDVSMQQLGIDPENILQMNKMGSRPDRQIGDVVYDPTAYAHGGVVHRAGGSPEEGERLTPQQIERMAAQDVADREAASTAAFIAQKSGIGRKEGNISKALKSGEGQVEMAKGLTMMPQNILGAPVDIATMAMRPFGYDVEKPVMGSEWLKEQTRNAGMAFKPSEDPTLAGFFEAGNIASGMVNPAGVVRSGVQAAEKTGEAAKMLARDFQKYNQQLEVPGATYVRRPAGGVFPTAKGPDEAPVSALDIATQRSLNTMEYFEAPPETKEAVRQFFETKMHDYFKTKASSVSDPVREALINGRIKIPKDTPLEEEFPQALLNAARAGDVTAMRDIENRFDKMMGVKSYRAKKADEEYDVATNAQEGFNQVILQQMKDNPQVIPDEMLLRLAKKDTSKLSKQEQAAEVANIRQKLADNPTLFNIIFEPKISRLLSERPVESVSQESLARSPEYYPALTNANSRQEGIMALNADVPITDLESRHGLPTMFGMHHSDLVEQAAKMDPKELSRMSVPEFFAKAVPAMAKEKDFERKAEKVELLAKAGKPVPKDIAQYGTKEFLPTAQGMTWREIVDPQGTIVQSKFLGNSIAGYSKPGTYGAISKGSTALKNGEVRLFGLYDKDGNVVTNVEFVTPKVENDSSYKHKANTITQMYGNGVRTGNVVPENYPQQMIDLVEQLKPRTIPPSIKELIYNYNSGITPPAPTNPPGWGDINLANGGMIERQPNDNRRYL